MEENTYVDAFSHLASAIYDELDAIIPIHHMGEPSVKVHKHESFRGFS